MKATLEKTDTGKSSSLVTAKGGVANAPTAGVADAQKSGPAPKPDATKSAENQDETILMAMNIYAEARGESDEGKSAVGQVVYNRVNGRKSNGKAVTWWGDSIKGVITKKYQFSWLNDRNSPEYKNAINPTEEGPWEKCYSIAKTTIAGGGTANLTNANGYVADSYCANNPSWATNDKLITKIGHHKFYTSENLKLNGAGATTTTDSGTATGTTSGGQSTSAAPSVSLDINAVKTWYNKQGYSKSVIKEIQKAVGFTDAKDVDGIVGKNTINKVAEWQSSHDLTPDGKFGSKSAEVAGISLTGNSSTSDSSSNTKTDTGSGSAGASNDNSDGQVAAVDNSEIPTQKEVQSNKSIFGHIDHIPLTKITPAYQLYYGNQTCSTISVHEKVASRVQNIFSQVKSTYSEAEIKELGLNQYSGCYNKRKMTSGSSWSIHSWGIAIDIDAARNPYTPTGHDPLASDKAKKFWDIVEANGGYSLGRHNGKDWMHFQFAKFS